jgi:hypothetical protein
MDAPDNLPDNPEVDAAGEDAGSSEEAEWLHPHVHEPNPAPPTAEPDFVLRLPSGESVAIDLATLAHLPHFTVRDCYIVSTGHGTSGPFAFGGVRLADLLAAYLPAEQPWRYADVVSADGFGNRIYATELATELKARPALLSTHLDGVAMTRAQGLVRLVVPDEKDDALRQVKWIIRIDVR